MKVMASLLRPRAGSNVPLRTSCRGPFGRKVPKRRVRCPPSCRAELEAGKPQHRRAAVTRSVHESVVCSVAANAAEPAGHTPRYLTDKQDGVTTKSEGRSWWDWNGHPIAYQQRGNGPIRVVLVHGMGASSDHWERLMAELGSQYTVYAVDMLGFGFSARPDPGLAGPRGHLYNFDTWCQQLVDFVEQVVQTPVILIGNSAGGLAALQTAVSRPDLVQGLLLLDCSMRHMHERNQPTMLHPLIAAYQWLLHKTPVGHWAYQELVTRPNAVFGMLQSAYGQPSALSPELAEKFREQLSLPGSCEVLLDVISNSTGPLPQDFLPELTKPTLVVWGANDPWEPVDLAEKLFTGWAAVTDFVVLPGVGHFPQDEVPSLIAAMLDNFVTEHVLSELEAATTEAPAPAAAGSDAASRSTRYVRQHSIEGLMAAAALDAKV